MLKDAFCLHACIVLAGGLFGLVSDDRKPPALPTVKFPDVKVPERPVIVEPVSSLAVGEMYVIDSNAKALVTSSPVGRVKVTVQTLAVGEKLTVIGKFVDGTGIEIRTYKADAGPRFLYVVTAVGKGPVEIIVATELDEASVVRRTLEVTGGSDPTPPPVTDQFVKDLRTAFAQETATDQALMSKLVEVYTYTGDLVNKDATWVGVFNAMQVKSESLKLTGKLMKVKTVIQAELKKVLPTGTLPADQKIGTDADKAKAVFDKVIAGLKQVVVPA